MSVRPWTDYEKSKLKRLVAEGLTARAIGEAMNRPRSGVIGMTRRMKLTLLLSPKNAKTPKKERVRSVAVRGAPKPARIKAMEKARSVAMFNMPNHGRLNAIKNARLQAEAAAKAADLAAAAGGTPFLAAVEGSLCLFYAGSHLTRGGPEMPVCGQPRPGTGRYCAHHARVQYGAVRS
jgi:hypothetical protein